MQVLGIECDKESFSYVLVDRLESGALHLTNGQRKAPPNSTRQDSLSWIYNEVRDLVTALQPAFAGLKRADLGINSSNAVLQHAEVDGVVQAALGSLTLECESFQWKSLASRLGASNKAAAVVDLKSREAFRQVARSRMAALGTALVARSS